MQRLAITVAAPGRSRLLIFALAFLAVVAAGAFGANALDATLLLQDVAAGAGPSWLKRWSAEPTVSPENWSFGSEPVTGDVYRGNGAPQAAILLVPGADRRGKDDPRLTALARSLARSRFLVLVPDLPNLRQLRVRPEDASRIAAALRHLAGEPAAAGLPLGVAAISYALAPALLAALEPDLAPRLRFVFGLGGFYDSDAAVRFFTTGDFRLPGETTWRYIAPNAYGKWLFVLANSDVIADAADRTTLIAIAERRLARGDAEIGGLAAMLHAEGRAVFDLVENRDPALVPSLIAALPTPIRTEMQALSPAAHDLHALQAELILVHGRNDAIVPFSESVALAGAVPHAHLFLLDDLAHVDLRPAHLGDAWTLWRAAYALVSERR